MMISCCVFFFFNDTATTEIYTFPYTTLFRSRRLASRCTGACPAASRSSISSRYEQQTRRPREGGDPVLPPSGVRRSEEHTSELQSRQYLVCRLLLEKKKTTLLLPETPKMRSM